MSPLCASIRALNSKEAQRAEVSPGYVSSELKKSFLVRKKNAYMNSTQKKLFCKFLSDRKIQNNFMRAF